MARSRTDANLGMIYATAFCFYTWLIIGMLIRPEWFAWLNWRIG